MVNCFNSPREMSLMLPSRWQLLTFFYYCVVCCTDPPARERRQLSTQHGRQVKTSPTSCGEDITCGGVGQSNVEETEYVIHMHH